MRSRHAGGRIAGLTAIGGGSRSALWLRIVAAAMQRTLHTAEGSDVGPALGAARLARVCSGDASAAETFVKPAITARFDPCPALIEALTPRRALSPPLPRSATHVHDPGDRGMTVF